MRTDILTFGNKLVSFSQNNEDVRLFGYFEKLGKTGFYVDIGANHPIHDSVTKFFYLRNWKGINIEPQEHLYKLLAIDRPRDKNLCVGIAAKTGKAMFRQYEGDGLSTFSQELHESYERGHTSAAVKFKESSLSLMTLHSVLAVNAKNKAIHFMKVDVEGLEYEVIKSNNWNKYRPWVICIESTGSDKRWEGVLKRAGYIGHMFDGLNAYYVAKEHKELIEGYRAIVASEVIRYDIAGLKRMRLVSSAKQHIKRLKH